MLTKKQEIALFKILEVPYSTMGNRVVGDNLLVETHSVTGASRAAKTTITSFLASEIYTDSEVEEELVSLIDLWISIGTDVTAIENGAVGDISGISDSAAAEKEEIRRQVLVLVPFYRYADELMRKRGGTISLIR